MSSTQHVAHRETLHADTIYESVHLTLGDMQTKVEEYFGRQLQRENENTDTCELASYSPNNICLLRVRIYESDGGWRFGGHGDVHRETWDDLCNLDKQPVEVEYVRETGQMIRIEHRLDGTVTEKCI